jgi:hypothetical protein
MPCTRPYDRQRAICEDPAVVQSWSTLVQSMKAKHSIVDKDMYDFDKFGFLTGRVSSRLVGTDSEKPGWEAVETPTYRSRVDYPGKTRRVDGESRLPQSVDVPVGPQKFSRASVHIDAETVCDDKVFADLVSRKRINQPS